ncbi:MAG: archease [Candidatus Poseidoniia archaeon]|nr:archease [Candidatus Poseidoniia archaeon]MDP6658374.1 archease [Candidatus Poseidoniia archaeon]MDP7007007.1 archease [Candidatus Poseidoniia archaeon]|tara:strand:- start:81 stop:485 length:405 start_codon:yes stop_codon:yes gene_type:complete
MRRTFEHTADIGLAIEAESLDAAFGEAALALVEVITGSALPPAERQRAFTVEAKSREQLLVRFLSRLLVEFDGDGFLPGAAEVTLASGRLATTLHGAIWDAERDGYGVEVKAISYHDLLVAPGPPARLRVILDL